MLFPKSLFETVLLVDGSWQLCSVVETSPSNLSLIFLKWRVCWITDFIKASPLRGDEKIWSVWLLFRIISDVATDSFLFFGSGHRDQIACSLLGGFSKTRTAAIQSLDSVPIFRIMCYVSLMALVPPPDIPPPELHVSKNLPAHASLSPPLASSPSVFRLFTVPPSSAGCHPPSVRMTDWRPVPCCPWFPFQCPDVWGFAPPDLCG